MVLKMVFMGQLDMTALISIAKVKEFNPHSDVLERFLNGMAKGLADDEQFPLHECLDNGSTLHDVLWALRCVDLDIAVKFSRECAAAAHAAANSARAYASADAAEFYASASALAAATNNSANASSAASATAAAAYYANNATGTRAAE